MERFKEIVYQINDLLKSKDYIAAQSAFDELAELILNAKIKSQYAQLEIYEVEFAHSALPNLNPETKEEEEDFHQNPTQAEFAKFYIHKTKANNKYKKPSFTGFDITIGLDGFYGTILVTSTVSNGEKLGLSASLHKLLGFEVNKSDGKTPELENAYKRADGLDLLNENSSIYLEFNEPKKEIYTGRRVRLVKDYSGLTLRYASGLDISSKLNMSKISEEQDFSETNNTITLEQDTKSSRVESEGYDLANKRYASLLKRNFEKKLDYFLFINVYLEGKKASDILSNSYFSDFNFTSNEVIDLISFNYLNPSVLRAKNKQFSTIMNKYKSEIKTLKNEYKKVFNESLDKRKFCEEFFFSDKDKEKRVCGYCETNEAEIEELFKQDKVFTKRQYSRGRTLEVDKIDPNSDYNISNIILSCYWCNNAKTDEFSDTEFKELIAPGIRAVFLKRLKK